MVFLDHDHRSALDRVLAEEKPRSVLLITGGASFDASPAAAYLQALRQRIHTHHCGDLGSNPEYEQLRRIVASLEGRWFDLVLALGGGSVIDYAKLLSLYARNPALLERDFTDLTDTKTPPPIVAVPTTAGSGSEATHFAVLYKGGEKHSIAHNGILPRHVVVDPALSATMPAYITACSGMDALCQAIESVWARGADIRSRKLATQALSLIVPQIERAVLQPSMPARRAMALGAYYAGDAINISKTTGPHALSYYLTQRLGVPHGEAVGMTIEAFVNLNYDSVSREVKDTYHAAFEVNSKEALIQRLRSIKEAIGLRLHPHELGLTPEQLNEYLSSVNLERLSNNPVPLESRDQLHELLTSAPPGS